jgi:hypothetical protein
MKNYYKENDFLGKKQMFYFQKSFFIFHLPKALFLVE